MASEQKATKKPLFYPLTHEEVLDLKDLTGVEIKVFLYVRTLDPFGDRNLEYSVTAVAEELGLSKGAVSKAIKSLDAKGFIHVELTRVKIRIKADKFDVASFPIGNSVSHSELGFPIGNQDCLEETEVSYKKPELPIGNNQQPESSPDKASSSPQTIQTYTDFKQTLSEEERANFLIFCKELTSNLSQPVNDIEAWLASENKAGQNRWEVYYQKFSVRREEQAKKATRKTGRQLMEELHAELEQKRQQAMEILNREQEQAMVEQQRRVTHV